MLVITSAIIVCIFLSGLATLRYYYALKAAQSLSQKGLDSLSQLLEIIKLIQQHRALHVGSVNGNKEFEQKLSLVEADLHHRFKNLDQLQSSTNMLFKLGTKSLKIRWEQLINTSFETGEQSFRAHSYLISRALDCLWEIADKFSLTTHQKPEIRNLSNQMVKALPELTESLAQVRGLSVQVASQHEISADKKLQLMYTLSRIEARLSSLNNHFSSSSLQQLNAFLEIIRHGMKHSSLSNQDPDYLFKESTQVIDKLYECILEGYKTINLKIIS